MANRTSPSSTFYRPFSFLKMPGRLISRTSPFEGDRDGASPSPAANFNFRYTIYEPLSNQRVARKSSFVYRKFQTPDGERESCLSYKEMLKVQFLLGRPISCW